LIIAAAAAAAGRGRDDTLKKKVQEPAEPRRVEGRATLLFGFSAALKNDENQLSFVNAFSGTLHWLS
jgi:hypothetical protein